MGSVSWLGDAPSSWANQHELRDVGSPSPWHGSPLQGIVIVCSATRISSDSKEQVCTPDGARGDAQNLLGVWEPGRGETKGWGLEWTEPGTFILEQRLEDRKGSALSSPTSDHCPLLSKCLQTEKSNFYFLRELKTGR